MQKFIPILDWLPRYNAAALSGDLSAGITVGIMLVPQGMAYAMLAGLPPIYGLYASTIPIIIYALLGTSRQLAVGPVAMVSLLVASGVGAVAEIGGENFLSLAILLALMVGIIQFTLGILRLGFLANFLSHPVISGFTSAAALIIGFSQLKHLLGLDIPRGQMHETLLHILDQFSLVNLPTLAIGLGSILIILVSKKINKSIPSPLIVVLLGVLISYLFKLDASGVQIIEDVPGGLPQFVVPSINQKSIILLLPIAITISLVSYIQSFAVAKAIHAKHKNYVLDPNQELMGLGLANIGGSLFQSFPVTGGFSRTAVNDQAGASTGMASIISASIVLLTLLFLTPYFYYLPKAVLAAIIIVAVFGLIDISEIKHLWQYDKIDFVNLVITALATLFIGIEPGIFIGVAFSLLTVLYRVSYPHLTELGKLPGSDTFRNVSRFDNLTRYDKSLIIRFDAEIFFGNSNIMKNSVLEMSKVREGIENVIIEATGITHMDSTAIHMLRDLSSELKAEGISLRMVDVKGPLRDIFKRNKIIDLLGEENFFLTIKDAIEFSNDVSTNEEQKRFVFQTDEH